MGREEGGGSIAQREGKKNWFLMVSPGRLLSSKMRSGCTVIPTRTQ